MVVTGKNRLPYAQLFGAYQVPDYILSIIADFRTSRPRLLFRHHDRGVQKFSVGAQVGVFLRHGRAPKAEHRRNSQFGLRGGQNETTTFRSRNQRITQ